MYKSLLVSLLTLAAVNAHAVLVFTFTESGGNVQLTSSGAVDLSSPISTSSGFQPSGGMSRDILNDAMQISTGNGGSLTNVDIYNFNTSGLDNGWFSNSGYNILSASGVFGAIFSIDISGGLIELSLPQGYFSNNPLPNGSATFSAQSFASLGLNPGSYNAATLTNGDSVQVNVLSSAIPEPSTWLAMISISGLLGLVGYRRWRSQMKTAEKA